MLFARGIIPAIAGSLLVIAAPVYAQQESQQNSQQSGQRDDDESETATTSTQFTPLDITQTTRSSSERDVTAEGSSGSGTDKINRATSSNDAKRPEPKLSEFEQFLASMAGRKVSRFGADLLVPSATDYSVPSALVIPPDYPIGVGDVIAINLTGSVVGSAEFPVDANGRIFLPNIGEVSLIGVRYRDLKRHVSQAIGAQYRGYDVSVSIKKLHGIRVFVTGFAQQPGVYTVNSLSTLLGALIAAGGPNAGGSLRSVKLYRNGQEVQDFVSISTTSCARAIARAIRSYATKTCCSFPRWASKSP
jgi:polysaccharide biosynthesis/export protein